MSQARSSSFTSEAGHSSRVGRSNSLAAEAVEMTAYEDFVTEEVRKGRSILGLYPATDERSLSDFAAWRKERGR